MRPAKQILLVEDEPTLQRILGSVLSDAGHRVESVGTAEQALDRLGDVKAADVDLVLSDKNLPAKSGLDLLESLRALEKRTRRVTGFILVTGYPSRDSAMSVLAHDGDGYLVKPFRSLTDAVDQIQRVLDASLEKRRAGCPDARRLAQLLSGVPAERPATSTAAVMVNDAAIEARIRKALAKANIRVDEARSGPAAAIASRIEDLQAFAKQRPGSSLVLVESGASFADIVGLISSGGGAIVDPGLIPVSSSTSAAEA